MLQTVIFPDGLPEWSDLRVFKVTLGYNRKKLEKKHWAEMIENPRRPIIHWHVLKVAASIDQRCVQW